MYLFFYRLERMSCPNRSCGCLAIVHDLNARSAITKYLTWFECRHKHEQDSIVFEWLRYVLILKGSNEQRKGMKNGKVFRLPFVDNGTDDGTDVISECAIIYYVQYGASVCTLLPIGVHHNFLCTVWSKCVHTPTNRSFRYYSSTYE